MSDAARDIGNRTVRTGLQNTSGIVIAALVLPLINQLVEPDLTDIQLLALAGVVYTAATLLWNWLEENTAFPRILKGEPASTVDVLTDEKWEAMANHLRETREDVNSGFSQVLDILGRKL